MSFKNYAKHILFITYGSVSFNRHVEWPIIFRYLEPGKKEKICDIACGDGTLSLLMAKKGSEVSAIDLSDNAIKHAKEEASRENITVDFKIGNAENLPYESRYFDKVVSSCALEHFHNDFSALKEMNRILKPSGILVLTVDSFTYPKTNEYLKKIHKKIAYVVNYYGEDQLKNKLEQSGFEIIKSEYYLNSYISHRMVELGITHEWTGITYKILSLLLYPLGIQSDKLFGNQHGGYGLAVIAKKSN